MKMYCYENFNGQKSGEYRTNCYYKAIGPLCAELFSNQASTMENT
jgi:hypothetical protein